MGPKRTVLGRPFRSEARLSEGRRKYLHFLILKSPAASVPWESTGHRATICSQERPGEETSLSISSVRDEGLDWQPDWKLFPSELKIKVRKHRLNKSARPRIPRLEGKNKRTSDAEALKQLDEMVKKEVEEDQSEDKKEEEAEDESGDEELEYDEEEQEEENDYLVSHFDDDEDAFMDDDDMDEGPIY